MISSELIFICAVGSVASMMGHAKFARLRILYLILILAIFAVWATANAAGRRSSFLTSLVSDTSGLLLNVEGLRSFLAVSVFLHHAIISRSYLTTGVWQIPENTVFIQMGQSGVALFFIITAFLFWGKALATSGRIDILKFFKGRLLRLAPLYITVTLGVFLITALMTSFTLQVPTADLVRSAVRWLSLGFFSVVALNGFDAPRVIAGVFWSLQYEWKFYIALPVLVLILRLPLGRFLGLAAALVAMIVTPLLLTDTSSYYYTLFCGGIIVATLWHIPRFQAVKLPSWLTDGLTAVLLISLPFFPTAYGYIQVLILTVLFLVILKSPQSSVLGRVLQAFPSRVLGLASYSIYMIHGVVLFTLTQALLAMGVRQLSDLQFAGFVLSSGTLVVFASFFLFQWVEHPFFKRDRKSLRRLLRRSEATIR